MRGTTSLILDWAVTNMRKAPHNLVSGRARCPEPKSFMHGWRQGPI